MSDDVKFCILNVVEHFEKCLVDDDDVNMDEYLLAYTELNKFFALMGKVFGFVSSDVKEKVQILEAFRLGGEQKANFETFKSMMEHEQESALLEKKGYVSGSRTLLRLHRGMDFIREFLRQLGEIEKDEKTGQCCLEAYNSTLANFHPWLIRKGVAVSVFALPTRDNLLTKVCSNVQEAIDSLPRTLKVMSVVYDRTQDLYTKYDLHGLP